jgi:hypothetical protein
MTRRRKQARNARLQKIATILLLASLVLGGLSVFAAATVKTPTTISTQQQF